MYSPDLSNLRISDSLTVADLATIQDCDEAVAYLTRGIAAIEAELWCEQGRPPTREGAEWEARARQAITAKRAIREVVQRRRGEFNRQAKRVRNQGKAERLIRAFRQRFPGEYYAVVKELRESGDAA